MTITGRVGQVAEGGDGITFAEPVHGISGVLLTGETQILAADGSAITKQGIRPGDVIQASGSPDGSGSVVAKSIRLLDDPAPSP